ncbi:hypothetical protein NBRC116494_25060 [Aurantivibrio plasticivorans]
MSNIDLIKETIATVDTSFSKKIDFVAALGTIKETIAADVLKYSPIDQRITHFIVFKSATGVREISFYCDNLDFSLQEIEANFGDAKIGYNFRENYSQFTFALKSEFIDSLFFIRDNKYDISDRKKITETTPRGDSKKSSDLTFNAFCLKFREQKIT